MFITPEHPSTPKIEYSKLPTSILPSTNASDTSSHADSNFSSPAFILDLDGHEPNKDSTTSRDYLCYTPFSGDHLLAESRTSTYRAAIQAERDSEPSRKLSTPLEECVEKVRRQQKYAKALEKRKIADEKRVAPVREVQKVDRQLRLAVRFKGKVEKDEQVGSIKKIRWKDWLAQIERRGNEGVEMLG